MDQGAQIRFVGELRRSLEDVYLHLVNAGRERLKRTVEELNKLNIEEMVPCHCTGDEAMEYLSENLNCLVTPGYAGMRT